MTVVSNPRTHTKITGAPDYDDPAYWDAKFATGQDVGEWLNPGEGVLQAALSHLDRQPHHQSNPRVLHLGPGISKLGTKIRDEFVAREWAGNGIVNVDFSLEAVRLGQELESKEAPSHSMHWLQADLRCWTDMSSLSRLAPFDVILDKSTSDSISTSASVTPVIPSKGEDPVCPLVYEVIRRDGKTTFSPVELLGLHLVPFTQKGSTWFALSYSTMRFDNLPYLSEYWELVDRIPLEAPRGQTASGAFTPAVYHWLYILRRN